ncbi:integrase core domain-containing protein [Patescibacteria group bacterium]
MVQYLCTTLRYTMTMPYTTNPHLPGLRMQAAKLVLNDGWSMRQVARYYGYSHSTIVRWVRKAKLTNRREIPTESSRPHSHPKQLSREVIQAILYYRHKYRRCAEVIHHYLKKDGIQVSLSSVKRTLRRHGLTYPSKWKRWHKYEPRPLPEKPGILVQIDTMQEGMSPDCLRAYALIDVHSRWVYAEPAAKANNVQSFNFFLRAQKYTPFSLQMIQSDHGAEFSKWFKKGLAAKGISHRHTRVRRPTDNGHIERFMRTIQQECLHRIPRTFYAWQKAIPDFIHYYNHERPHMALNMKTPNQVVRSY